MAPVLGVILAGGLSRRMGGGDKPLVRLGGRTLLDRVAERFAPQCAAGLILNANGDPDRFGRFDGAIVPDGVPGNPGPLAGILAALDYAAMHCGQVEAVASATGDAPFLPADLVRRLAGALAEAQSIVAPLSHGRGSPGAELGTGSVRRTIAVAASGGRQHFTTALWSLALRDDLRAALVDRGERRVGSYLARHGAIAVDWPATPIDPFLNVNTPEDLAAAEALLGSEGA